MVSRKVFFCAVMGLVYFLSSPCGRLCAAPKEKMYVIATDQQATVLQKNAFESGDLETIDVSLLESMCFSDAPLEQDASLTLLLTGECEAKAPSQKNVLCFDGVCFDDQPLAAFALSCYQQDPKVIKDLQNLIEQRLQHCDFCLALLLPMWMKQKADFSIESLAEKCFKGASTEDLLENYRVAHGVHAQLSMYLDQRSTLESMPFLIAQLFYEVGSAPEHFHVMSCDFLGKPAEVAWKKGPFWCSEDTVSSSACGRLAHFFRAERRNKTAIRLVLAPLLKGLCLLKDHATLGEQMRQSVLAFCQSMGTGDV
ncbi:MAG: hypothetical protein V6Z78_01330 [Holosporaceae bacterium]